RQPSDSDCGLSIQLNRKLARYWVNSVEQEQVRRARGHNPDSPKKDATPAPGALPPNPASNEMQNLWPTVPEPNGCRLSLPGKLNRAKRPAGNKRERRLGHEQLPCEAVPQPQKDSLNPPGPDRESLSVHYKLWRRHERKNHRPPGRQLVFLRQTPSH